MSMFTRPISFVNVDLLDDDVMRQFRNCPIVNIELHDRDKRMNSRRCVGSVFGTEITDESIGRVTGSFVGHASFVRGTSFRSRQNESIERKT
jgi:hypothetical protein